MRSYVSAVEEESKVYSIGGTMAPAIKIVHFMKKEFGS